MMPKYNRSLWFTSNFICVITPDLFKLYVVFSGYARPLDKFRANSTKNIIKLAYQAFLKEMTGGADETRTRDLPRDRRTL